MTWAYQTRSRHRRRRMPDDATTLPQDAPGAPIPYPRTPNASEGNLGAPLCMGPLPGRSRYEFQY